MTIIEVEVEDDCTITVTTMPTTSPATGFSPITLLPKTSPALLPFLTKILIKISKFYVILLLLSLPPTSLIDMLRISSETMKKYKQASNKTTLSRANKMDLNFSKSVLSSYKIKYLL